MPEQLPTDVRNLTPATRLIYSVLEEGPMTADDLESRTGLSPKSIYDCTNALEEINVIEIRPHPMDARKQIYEMRK